MNESTILVKLFTKKSEHFNESTNISIKKSQKLVKFHSLKMSQKLVKYNSPKKVKFLVNQQKCLQKITKIVDILLVENVTKIGENSFTKKGEHYSESTKISIK